MGGSVLRFAFIVSAIILTSTILHAVPTTLGNIPIKTLKTFNASETHNLTYFILSNIYNETTQHKAAFIVKSSSPIINKTILIQNAISTTESAATGSNDVLISNTPCGISEQEYKSELNAYQILQTQESNTIDAAMIANSPTQQTLIFNCPIMFANLDSLNSTNWGGYVVVSNIVAPSPDITAINGSWVVQEANTAEPNAANSPTFSAQWIGIGGYKDGTLIQTGTSSDFNTSNSDVPSYSAWYELLPAAETELNIAQYPVHPNDIINANIHLISGNEWSIKIIDKNQTDGWTYNTVVQYDSSKLSGEVIDERPEIYSATYGGYILSNLTYFGVGQFGEDHTGMLNSTYIDVGNAIKPLGMLNYSAINMVDNSESQELASPLAISGDGTSFSMIYGPTLYPSPAASDYGASNVIINSIEGGGPYTYNWYLNNQLLGADSNALTFDWNTTTNSLTTRAVYLTLINQTTNEQVTKSSEVSVEQSKSPLGIPKLWTANVQDAYPASYYSFNYSETGGSLPVLSINSVVIPECRIRLFYPICLSLDFIYSSFSPFQRRCKRDKFIKMTYNVFTFSCKCS